MNVEVVLDRRGQRDELEKVSGPRSDRAACVLLAALRNIGDVDTPCLLHRLPAKTYSKKRILCIQYVQFIMGPLSRLHALRRAQLPVLRAERRVQRRYLTREKIGITEDTSTSKPPRSLNFTDIIHRVIVTTLAGITVGGCVLGYLVHRDTLRRGRG